MGTRGDGNGGEDTSLTVSQRGRLPGKRGCASRTPLARLGAHSRKLLAVGPEKKGKGPKQKERLVVTVPQHLNYTAISMQTAGREWPARQHTPELLQPVADHCRRLGLKLPIESNEQQKELLWQGFILCSVHVCTYRKKLSTHHRFELESH